MMSATASCDVSGSTHCAARRALQSFPCWGHTALYCCSPPVLTLLCAPLLY